MSRKLTARLTAILVAVLFVAAACGDDDGDDSSGDDGGSDADVAVVLTEWAVTADPTTADAGSLVFEATNEGGDAHELVIVRGDDPEALPIDDTGKVIEDDLAEGDFIGEIEEFDSGGTESATFDLDAGDYILFCNIVEEEADGQFESHFLEGMVTEFVVS